MEEKEQEKPAFEPNLDWLDEALGPLSSPPVDGADTTEMDAYLDEALGPDGWLNKVVCPKCGAHNCTKHEQAPEAEAAPAPGAELEPEAEAAPETLFATREGWLQGAVQYMTPWYTDLGHELPFNLRISCGWPGTGKRSKRIGECWSAENSADGATEIFISPTQADPIRVLDVLCHELLHAAIGLEHKHGKVFKQYAGRLGLQGKMTATEASPELRDRLTVICQALGAYPHAELTAMVTSAPPKQTTRLVKVGCPSCEVIARMTRKWVEADMLPQCPCGVQWEVL